MGKLREHNLGLKLPSRVYFKHGAFYFVTRQNKWIKLGTDYKKAVEQYDILNSNIKAPVIIADLINRYIAEIMPNFAKGTQEREEFFLKNIKIAFGAWGINEVKPKNIYQYLDARNAKVSANREIKAFKKVLSHAIRWGVIEHNPCLGIKLHAEKPRQRHVTLREIAIVKNLAHSSLAALIEFAFITAARQGEIIALKKDCVTQDGLLLEDFKNKQKFIIKISARLKKLIDRLPTASHLFSNEKGKPWTSTAVKSAWQRLMKRAIESGKLNERFTFHDIRAAAITHIANKDGLEAARNLAGHKNQETTGRVYYRGIKSRKTSI